MSMEPSHSTVTSNTLPPYSPAPQAFSFRSLSIPLHSLAQGLYLCLLPWNIPQQAFLPVEILLILPPPVSCTALAHYQTFMWILFTVGFLCRIEAAPGPGPSPLAVSTASSTSHHRIFPIRVLWMEMQGQDLLCSNDFPKRTGWYVERSWFAG